jgi:hypothetical protein
MKTIERLWLVAIMVVALPLVGCKSDRSAVIFWPDDAVQRRPSDYRIDPLIQSEALKAASPENDAAQAFSRGDLRLVGDRLTHPRFFGVPDDSTTQKLRVEHRFKVIGFSEQLRESEEFRRNKLRYEEVYNKTIYDLVVGTNRR